MNLVRVMPQLAFERTDAEGSILPALVRGEYRVYADDGRMFGGTWYRDRTGAFCLSADMGAGLYAPSTIPDGLLNEIREAVLAALRKLSEGYDHICSMMLRIL